MKDDKKKEPVPGGRDPNQKQRQGEQELNPYGRKQDINNPQDRQPRRNEAPGKEPGRNNPVSDQDRNNPGRRTQQVNNPNERPFSEREDRDRSRPGQDDREIDPVTKPYPVGHERERGLEEDERFPGQDQTNPTTGKSFPTGEERSPRDKRSDHDNPRRL